MDDVRRFLKILGNGPKTARDLNDDEATHLMQALLAGQFTQAQLGALWLIMRRKVETPTEFLAFVKAWERQFPKIEPHPNALMMGDPFDGKTRSIYMSPLASLLLCVNGIEIFAGGTDVLGPKYGRTFQTVLNDIIGQESFKPLPHPHTWDINSYFPIYESWLESRNEIGLRSFIHTVEKCLNPFGAGHRIQAFHHIQYVEVFNQLGGQGDHSTLLVQGDGGTPDLKLRVPTRYVVIRQGKTLEGFFDPTDAGLTELTYHTDTDSSAIHRFWNEAVTQTYSREASWLVAQAALLLLGVGRGERVEDNLPEAREALDKVRALLP